MKTQSPSKEQKMQTRSLFIGAISIFLAVGMVSLLAVSLGMAQMA